MGRFLWTQKEDIGPTPRQGHAMAYDILRRRVVLFGGGSLGSDAFNDTWEWDGEYWTQISDIGPSPRQDHAMVYNPASQRILLFGGRQIDLNLVGIQDVGLGDTWEWDGEDWVQITDSGPIPRYGHSMAFDSNRQRTVLFAGYDPKNGPLGRALGDTWEWDGQEWTQQEESGPSPRLWANMTFDSLRNRTVLFGGEFTPVAQDVIGMPFSVGDTWEWDGLTWRQVADFGPEPAAAAALVFQGARSALFGGFDRGLGNEQLFGSTWEWDGKHWTQKQDIGPAPRKRHAMCFDSANRRIVLFGGSSATGLFGDTWEHAVQSAPGDNPQPTFALASLTLSPSTIGRPIFSRDRVLAQLTFTGAAPVGGVSVQISSSRPDGLNFPSQVSVPAGSNRFDFTIEGPNAFQRGTVGTYEISARLDSVMKTARLTVS